MLNQYSLAPLAALAKRKLGLVLLECEYIKVPRIVKNFDGLPSIRNVPLKREKLSGSGVIFTNPS